MRIFAHLAVSLLLLAAACGSSGTPTPPTQMAADMASPGGSGGNGAVDGGKATATVTVRVPADFTGTPRQLLVAAFDSFPVTGPPAGILYQGMPALTAGQSLQLSGDATGLGGTEQVLAVLYVQGGGQFSPQPGVDYTSAPEQVTFTGAAIDLGTLTLALVPLADMGGP